MDGLAPAVDGQAVTGTDLAVDGQAVTGLTAAWPLEAQDDRRHLRSVFGRFATGVTVVAAGREEPRGMTANSFTSVSLDPPLVLVCTHQTALIHKAVVDCGSFAVSILSADQEHVARYFADSSRPRGTAEFAGSRWWPAPTTGAPILHGSLAWVDCELSAVYEGGDHSIFLGLVLASGYGTARHGLVFFGGDFHHQELRGARHP
ncbi:MAG TPA: flavin reductase family protein [Streptosporangiaceae bacterium]|nr:flavin reductase family protein [Streptosporangiaceae bacterium]